MSSMMEIEADIKANCKSIMRLLKFKQGKFKAKGVIDAEKGNYSPAFVNYERSQEDEDRFCPTVLNLLCLLR